MYRSHLLVWCLALTMASCQCTKPPPTSSTLKKEKEACANDEQCETGLCDGSPSVCLRKCSLGCTADEVCTQTSANRFGCQRDEGGLCRPCSADSECPYAADKCLLVDGIGVCGRDCSFDSACPTTYRCVNGVGVDGNAKSQQCIPTSGSCTCTAATAGQMMSCERTNSIGTCQGHRTCDGIAGYGACDAKAAALESCNGIDDDCDGVTDEDQPTVSCGVGQCRRTVSTCTDAGAVVCIEGDPHEELCNGLDDDCDGVNDNGFNFSTDVHNCASCGHDCKLPHATPKCADRTCLIDSCDLGFDNCDGLNSTGCETDLNSDANHCSRCGHQCMAFGATSSCHDGKCDFTCKPGYLDIDGDPANGCEYSCTFKSATDEPDLDFVDANCDGIDGELTNGVFVSATGSDTTGDGSMNNPKRTIAAGLALATSSHKRDVYVTSGAYTGPLAITNVTGKNIAGGYAPGPRYWTRASTNVTLVAGGNPALSLSLSEVLVQLMTFRGDSAVGVDSNGHGNSAYGAWVRGSNSSRLEGLTLVAGNAVSGADGRPGVDGTNGAPGEPGERGCTNDSTWLCNECSRPSGNAGGASACGRTGGAGGQPGWRTPNKSGSAGDPGANGLPTTSAGQGGTAFSSGTHGIPLPSQNGVDGADGANGSNGPRAPQRGKVNSTGYLPAVGGDGTDGQSGDGGGGGGGGGGGCVDLEVLHVWETCYCFTYGSTGGSGGGGACAGTAGTAGRSGGASIALMLFDSHVLSRRLVLQSGKGGNGGHGARGGNGATGGSGGESVYDSGNQGYSGIGGRGGRGGNAGAGGAGAGGAGGPSYGLIRNTISTINTSELSFQLGTGGVGGSSPATANSGPNGEVVQDQTL